MGPDTGAALSATGMVTNWDLQVASNGRHTLVVSGDRLLRAVAELNLCGEVHRGVGRWESLRKRKDGDVLTRNAVVELRHVVAP